MPRIKDPPNSEVSEQFLKRFAASAVAVKDFQDALTCDEEGNFNLLQYGDLKQDFKLTDLVCSLLFPIPEENVPHKFLMLTSTSSRVRISIPVDLPGVR